MDKVINLERQGISLSQHQSTIADADTTRPLERAEHPDDLHLLKGLKESDTVALRIMYDRYFPVITSYVRSNSGQLADAEDLFQDCMTALYDVTSSSQFRLTCSLRTFLLTVARNLWLKKLRKRGRERVMIDGSVYIYDEDGLHEKLLQHERYELYREKFQELGADCKLLLKLFFAKVPFKRIAEELGMASDMYARKRKRICKDRLEQMIRDDARYTTQRDDG